jgi:hypothetical protein
MNQLIHSRPFGRLAVCFDDVALARRHVVDPAGFDLVGRAEQALPAGDGVGANDRTANISRQYHADMTRANTTGGLTVRP